ncbi:DUF6149 family protein [Natrinema altunense]|uniref:Uncharacterized protein n=2 Tax=Natrinema altunense TaxID=222984 RepID=L9ZFZ4_NATA2|nr:DUF6149 family protein [Natrinema altunense]ELY84098.1 hypothetical protein C485_16665 [Natrinema altunense JCM 12890]RZH68122.1 hypothetical protein ELS17_01230 [Natrinema altunense]
MKLRQNAKHFAYRKALETPGIRSVANSGLVRLHTKIFAGKADPAHAEERTAHLDGLFDATMDAYLRALQEGYSEAEAREITHIQANFDFYNHGWTEMMEFPADELEAHYDRYSDFFDRWDVTIAEPLGQFAPAAGLPEAPSTPERLENPDHPHAEGGFADDVYVETSVASETQRADGEAVDDDGELVVGGRDAATDGSRSSSSN